MTATVAELATPSGVLVYDGPAHTDDWFAARRAGITATDLPAILGLSRYDNARSVWLDKRGELPPQSESMAAKYGTLLEPVVADDWAREFGTGVAPVGILAHHQHEHHRASLDRLVLRCPDGEGPCGLEVKCRSAFLASRWREDVPDDVYAQVQWQMHVSGYRHMHLAVLIGGNDPRWLRLERDEDDIALLVREAEALWAQVLDGTPPAARYDALMLEILKRRYPDREGQAELELATAEALRANWLDARQAQREADAAARKAKAAVTAATAALVDALGPAEAAYVAGRDLPAFTYSEHSRRGYTVAPATYRQIDVPEWDSSFYEGEVQHGEAD